MKFTIGWWQFWFRWRRHVWRRSQVGEKIAAGRKELHPSECKLALGSGRRQEHFGRDRDGHEVEREAARHLRGSGWRSAYGLSKARRHWPEGIAIVINAHPHFDHCGGNTRASGNRIVPSFPNARYIVQRAELENARNPAERHRASYFPKTPSPFRRKAAGISSDGKKLAFVADLFPTRHHISLPWIMAFDLYPLQTLETKRLWIPPLVAQQTVVVFGHDPDVPAATLHQNGDKIELEPVDLNR